ncbi:hypothetical protein SAY87_032232 [Trapa incisa]|uniref:tRNA/rRNA methyltransferase SpoU type domain-containing protein n=1 Tax=Trapa incisa TaxID=236973 RepID=A0AAN7KXE2_9MYRT|nr:hypothetical protein SAY87_032232 [Trapa incisa]
METCARFKTLSALPPLHMHFRSKSSLLRRLPLPPFKHKFYPSLFCSSAQLDSFSDSQREKTDVSSFPNGQGDPMKELQEDKTFLHVVLVSPQIPGNTGCIARTCAASAVRLHLVGPLGFQVDDSKLKRAGLDYWPYVVIKVHNSWEDFRGYFMKQGGQKRLLAFTKRGTEVHSEFSYRKGDWLVFGSETSGLPPDVLFDCKSEKYGGGTLRIPMVETYVRCLNLSVSVGIALYEACRQLKYEQLQLSSQSCMENEQPFITEDIFA